MGKFTDAICMVDEIKRRIKNYSKTLCRSAYGNKRVPKFKREDRLKFETMFEKEF